MSLTRWRSPTSPGSEPLNYRYSSLKSSTTGVRLARIKRGCGNKGISIDLVDSFITSPGQKPHLEYDALSYTWGNAARSKTILCNGRRLPVTPTLLEALHHFRDQDRDVVLWIDQICICQDRINERSQQVKLMGKIFAGARKVSVWLGPHADDSKAGMQLARQLLAISKHQNLRYLDQTRLEVHGLPQRGHRRWKALKAILRRPWFWRTWIVQEVVLNDNVELVLGDTSLTWDELEAIVELVEGPIPRQWHIDPTMSAWELPFSRINRIRLRHHRRKATQPLQPTFQDENDAVMFEEPSTLFEDDELDLLDLLLMSRDLQATDPLDKIYALLGLGQNEIIPDYSSPPEAVFNEFAQHVVGEVTGLVPPGAKDFKHDAKTREVRKALILLSCAGTPNQNLDGLHTWVPDWTANLTSRPLIFDTNYAAGGDVMDRLDWDYDTGLQLCGKLVDTVAAAGTVNLTYDETTDAAANIRQWWQETKTIAEKRAVRSPGSTMNVDAFHSLCRNLSLDDKGFYHGEGRTRRRASLLDESEVAQDSERRAQQTLILGPTRGRVLFVTTTGYLGLAPHGTQEGDLIYVILGSSVPYVLRPYHDGTQAFQLIGEAYVQGIMQGEALEMDWVGIEDVTIC